MNEKVPDRALYGDQGRRVVYAGHLAAALYANLTPEARSRVRIMVEEKYQGTETIGRQDCVLEGFTSARFTICDCVAECTMVFGPEDRPTATASKRAMTLDGILPETVRVAIPGRDMADVTGIETMRGIRARSVSGTDADTTIHYDDGTTYLVDPKI